MSDPLGLFGGDNQSPQGDPLGLFSDSSHDPLNLFSDSKPMMKAGDIPLPVSNGTKEPVDTRSFGQRFEDTARAGVQGVNDFISGGLGFAGASLGAVGQLLTGNTPDLGGNMEAIQKATEPYNNIRKGTPEEDKVDSGLQELVNRYMIPMAGVHLALPELGKGKELPKTENPKIKTLREQNPEPVEPPATPQAPEQPPAPLYSSQDTLPLTNPMYDGRNTRIAGDNPAQGDLFDQQPPSSPIEPGTPGSPAARAAQAIVDQRNRDAVAGVTANPDLMKDHLNFLMEQERQRALAEESARRNAADNVPTGYKELLQKLEQDRLNKQSATLGDPARQQELPLQTTDQQISQHGSEAVGQRDLFNTANNRVTPDTSTPPIQPQIHAMRALEASERGDVPMMRQEEALYNQRSRELGPTSPEAPAAPKGMARDSAGFPQTITSKTRAGKQRGAIDMSWFRRGQMETKKLSDGTVLSIHGDDAGPSVYAFKHGEVVGETHFAADEFANPHPDTSNLQASWTHVEPKARGNGLGQEMYKMARDNVGDIVPSKNQLPGGSALWKKMEENGIAKRTAQGLGISRSQRGSASFINDIANGVKKLVDSIGNMKLNHLTSKEEYLKNLPGVGDAIKDAIPAPDAPEKVIADTLAHGTDIPDLGNFTSLQSGPILTAGKFGDHPLLLGIGRIWRATEKATDMGNHLIAKPIQEAFSKLSQNERNDLHELLKEEMFSDKRYTDDQLQNAGFSKGQMDTYKMLRGAFDNNLKDANAARAVLGKNPITAKNAYLSSIRTGDWQFAVVDKEGNPVWFVRSKSKTEAKQAIQYLKDNHGDSLNLDNVKPTFRKDSSKYHPDIPQDVMGAYGDMLKYFKDDPTVSNSIRESMENFLENKGYGVLGHKQHFMEKNNIRGFEGDKPWLSDKENANNLLEGQINFLKNAEQWKHIQDATAQTKQILSNPDIISKMPNAVEYLNRVIAAQEGMGHNLLGGLESAIAKVLGRSSSNIYGGATKIKAAAYLQLLGLNTAHIIATPLQTLITTPAQHIMLSDKGFKHNVFKTTMNAFSDFTAAIAEHQLHELTGDTTHQLPMSQIGRVALKYMENNGIIEKNLFNENVKLGENPLAQGAKKLLGGTIAFPEKMARASAFMGFVHHLDASGKYEGDMNGLMRHAEELTENSLTSFRKSDRPMIVNQLGATGSLAYTFKSYLFNEFNQLSQLARHGVTTGNYSALLSHLGMLTVVGGVLSVPAVNEMDGLWNLVKDFIAEHNPELYRFVKGNGLKASIIEHLPDFASYGLASSVTGASLQNRFGTDVADPEHPLKNIFPLGQDIKELASGIGGLTHPNKTTATEALYQQMPAIGKGQMEAHMDMFKGEHQKGGDVVMNPNNLLEHKAIDHLRTPEDWNYRKWGMTSLAEAKDRQTGYSNSEENGRIKTATDSLGRNLFDAILRKNPGDVTSEAASYLRLNPNEEALKADLDKRIMASSLTPTQQAMARAQTYQQIDSVIRLMKERGQR